MQAMETVHLIAKERQGFKERKIDTVTEREEQIQRQREKNRYSDRERRTDTATEREEQIQ